MSLENRELCALPSRLWVPSFLQDPTPSSQPASSSPSIWAPNSSALEQKVLELLTSATLNLTRLLILKTGY